MFFTVSEFSYFFDPSRQSRIRRKLPLDDHCHRFILKFGFVWVFFPSEAGDKNNDITAVYTVHFVAVDLIYMVER